MSDMGRRHFITLLGGAAVAWPIVARAQQCQRGRLIGVLANEPWPPLEGLRDGMRALGYIDERGLHVEYRFAEGRAEDAQCPAPNARNCTALRRFDQLRPWTQEVKNQGVSVRPTRKPKLMPRRSGVYPTR